MEEYKNSYSHLKELAEYYGNLGFETLQREFTTAANIIEKLLNEINAKRTGGESKSEN